MLEQMLKRDGFTDNEIVGAARTAAEAQMRTSSAPIMDFPVESHEEEHVSGSNSQTLFE